MEIWVDWTIPNKAGQHILSLGSVYIDLRNYNVMYLDVAASTAFM
jgi:hypothetical protein